MNSLSIQNRFVLASVLPALGALILGLALLSGSSSLGIWFIASAIPVLAGLWVGLTSGAATTQALGFATNIINQTANRQTISDLTRPPLLDNLMRGLLNLNNAVTNSDSEHKEESDKLRAECSAADDKVDSATAHVREVTAKLEQLQDDHHELQETHDAMMLAEHASANTPDEVAQDYDLGSALEVCQAMVMLADDEMNIVYVNKEAKQMLSRRENELRQQLPNFSVAELIGTNADVFHANISHQRNIVSQLVGSKKSEISVGELKFDLITTPWTNSDGSRIGTVIEWNDKTEALKLEAEAATTAAENSRFAAALEVCQANVMMADENFDIIYANQSVSKMLNARESKIRHVLPSFSTANLIGGNIDQFHVNPSHQRSMVAGLKDTFTTDISVGDLTFGLIATPVFSDEGTRLGTVVEWEDKTDSLAKTVTEQAAAESNARIAAALKACQANVMMADNDLNIVYLNDSIEGMFNHRERELQGSLPNFNVGKLIGTCVDDFHVNPAHQRGMIADLRSVYQTDLPVAGLTFSLIATPVYGDNGDRLGTVVEWNDKTEALKQEIEDKQVSDENARVKQALDNVGTATMIADNDLNIIYMNTSAGDMMRNAESDIKRDLPNFNASTLVGTNIDGFHKSPSHQRGLLANLSGTYESELIVGGRTMTVTANSIQIDGERLGTVVEWQDRTDEVAIEREINKLVEAANAGDFTVQLDEPGKEGFFLNLSRGLNSLTSTANSSLTDVLTVMAQIAGGDLTQKLDKDYHGTFAALKDSVNGTVDKLTDVISGIRSASTSLKNGASEIATGNADLSQRTEEQASSLEETASSMEEMTSVVKQGAENSRSANGLAQTAREKAAEGGTVVQRAITAMEAINKSSSEIADIIGVIEEIAFQTNLLALNAAVEAARAGEQGRGFAVVAGEVRNLAQRSADASKDIKELIRNSEAKVSEGTNLVNESGKTLADIESAVVKVSTMIADITAGTDEQTSGIEQVNTAVAQMDEMTQQNAALVEEASASSEAVSEQAVGLTKMMEFFKTSDFTQPTSPAAAPSSSFAGTGFEGTSRSSSSFSAPAAKSFEKKELPSDDDEWKEF